MCGRYASSRRPEDLVEEFEVEQAELPAALPVDYNVAPTKEVYAVLERPARPQEGRPVQRQLRVVTWGLVPSWAKDPAIGNRMINARVETVADKPAYRKAFAARRCLLPADGYYEWYAPEPDDRSGGTPPAAGSGGKAGRGLKVRKQPFFIHPADRSVMAMAGLYEIWRDPTRADDDPARFRWTCTVLTTRAVDELGRIHDRMPLLVDRREYAAWLDPALADPDRLRGLLVPATPGRLEAFPVSTLVNDVRNNGPELVRPLAAEPAGQA